MWKLYKSRKNQIRSIIPLQPTCGVYIFQIILYTMACFLLYMQVLMEDEWLINKYLSLRHSVVERGAPMRLKPKPLAWHMLILEHLIDTTLNIPVLILEQIHVYSKQVKRENDSMCKGLLYIRSVFSQGRLLTYKLILQGFLKPRLMSTFRNFYGRYNNLIYYFKLSFSHMLSDIFHSNSNVVFGTMTFTADNSAFMIMKLDSWWVWPVDMGCLLLLSIWSHHPLCPGVRVIPFRSLTCNSSLCFETNHSLVYLPFLLNAKTTNLESSFKSKCTSKQHAKSHYYFF
jgi:hypothetical protein